MVLVVSKRELICARMFVVISAIDGVESSGRNLDRVADTKLPYTALYDGDENAFDNPRATGGAPNVVTMTPIVAVSLGEVPENIGTVTNEWLAKVQRAVLLDNEIEILAGGRSAPRRIPTGGARYVGLTSTLHEGRTTQLDLNVHFAITYPFNPNN